MNGLKVMLKPHVWMRGQWIGELDMQTEEEWKVWEKSYSEYILTYSRLADSLNADLFCVGTELKIAAVKRPEYWKGLIRAVREIYSGPLTYASNWDNYQAITFWEELDYIGIDAYFPLTFAEDPTAADINKGWEPIKREMKKLSRSVGRPVLLTEYGYQSIKGAAGNHWEVSRNRDDVDLALQARAYECLYQCLWKEDWVSGGFLWKWHFREGVGGESDINFTPQRKPVEAVISKWYGSHLTGIN